MRKPVIVEPRDMLEKESLQRLIEGLKLALSCSKEMQSLEPKRGWGKVTEALAHLIKSSHRLAHTKAQTRQALLQGTDEFAYRMGTDVR